MCDEPDDEMTMAILEIVNSSHFDRDEILAEKLTLSQAYCLLWQDTKNGNVCGRQSCEETNAGAVAAVLVDLIVLGKAEVVVEPNTSCGFKNDKILFKVIDEKTTGKYLDEALFDTILQKHFKYPGKPGKVNDWIDHNICKFQSKNLCSTVTLDSLVELGILDKKKTLIGFEYPTIKPGLEEELVRKIRGVALEHEEPSSYVRALLTLARTADNLICFDDPVLAKHFSKEEYGEAKKGIKALVAVGKKGQEKYEAFQGR